MWAGMMDAATTNVMTRAGATLVDGMFAAAERDGCPVPVGCAGPKEDDQYFKGVYVARDAYKVVRIIVPRRAYLPVDFGRRMYQQRR